jgi:hypothetical protein
MLGLKADAYQLNLNGEGQYEFFSDISTRNLETVRIGEGAGKISKGSGNAFVGYESGKVNNLGSFGVFVGFQAGALNQNGNFNTYVGAFAGKDNNRGDRNTFVGFQAGQLNKDGFDCTAVGAYAMRENTTGNKNVAVGNRAGERILDGDNNTMIGMEAGQDIRSGNNNTMAGYRSGRGSFKGNENTYFGAFSGYSNSIGDGNAFVGYKAGEFLTNGSFNVAVGAYALQKASFGDCNIAIGAFAGSVITGSGNVFVGTGAAASNTGGDNNTNVGNNAGFEGTGSDNVYIGKNAAYSLDGNQNVVIGVNAYTKETSTGSVIIGFNAGNTVFDTGDSNIFIGIGADAYVNQTSHAIAIGSKRTYAYTHSISIGEDIDNGGVNSISLGYNIFTDANQCITLGNTIDISSVQVFNDPLNYLFPINNTEAYRTFFLKENYTNTLFLNNLSNEVAIARINNSNLYDSGNNLLKGTTLTGNNNIRSIFNYNILYQGITFQYQNSSTTNFTYEDYLFNTDNVLTTDNFLKTLLTLETTGTFNLAANALERHKEIFFNGLSLNFLTSSSNLVSSNLIPINIPRFNYIIGIVKRYGLYKINNLNTYYTNPFTPVLIPTFCNITLDTDEILFNNINFTQSNYTLEYPKYGFLQSNLTINSNSYQVYPEAYYTSNDTLKIATINVIQNRAPTDINTYAIMAEDFTVPIKTIFYRSNLEITISSNIYLHPYHPTYFDRSSFNITPASNINTYMTIVNTNSNLLVSHLSRTSNYLQIAYSNFLTNPVILSVIYKNSNISDPLKVNFLDNDYYYNLIYSSNINENILSTSNIRLSILPFSLNSYTVPISTGQENIIIDYPKYGNITISSSITYTPAILHPKEDSFIIAVKYSEANSIYYSVTVGVSNVFHSITMNKMQQPVISYGESNSVILNSYYLEHNKLFNIQINSNQNLLNNASPYGETNYSFTRYTPYLGYYDTTQGYLYRSNIITNLTYVGPLDVALPGYPGVNDLDNGQGRDFIKYNTYLPRKVIKKYKWTDFSTPYETSTITLTASLDEIRYNGLLINRYYTLDKEFIYEEYYNLASNLTLYTSNAIENYDNYYDLYDNYIYTSNYQPFFTITSTSNYDIILETTSNLTYSSSNCNILRENFLNYNIPTVQVQKTYAYQTDGSYIIDINRTSNNLVVLERNIGRVYQFHQSNINNLDIHILNTQLSSALPTNLYITSNIYFTDKEFKINYFKDSSTVLTLANVPNQDITFNNNIATNHFIFRYRSDGSMLLFAIQHTSNITFLNNNTKIVSLNYSYEAGSDFVYGIASESYSNNAYIDYINYSVSSIGKPIPKVIPIQYKRNKPIYYNQGLSLNPIKYITSNELYYVNGTDNSYFKITNLNNVILKKENTILNVNDTFTQDDINTNKLSIRTPQTDSFTLDIYNNDISATSYTITTIDYNINNYLPAINSNITSNIILQTKDSYKQYLHGTLWDYLALNNKNVKLNIIKQPEKGFFASNNFQTITQITYNELLTKQIYYIPYTPMSLSNDYFVGFFELSNIISPFYTIPVKNYWSRWSDLVSLKKNYNTLEIPRSHGMIQDNITWSPNIIYNIPSYSNIELTLSFDNIKTNTDIYYLPITQRPYFRQSSNTINVDNGNYSYLDSILNHTNNPSKELLFSIMQSPRHGVILTKITENQFEARPQFTSESIRNKDVFYQHYGNIQTDDSFIVQVSTTPFDISSNSLSNIIKILDAPRLLANNYDYIFYEDINIGKSNYNLLDTSKLNLSKGFMYIYDTSNIDIYRSNTSNFETTNIIFANELATNKIYYRPNSNFFASGINSNISMSFKFTVNSNEQNIEPNRLSVIPLYKTLYTQEWFSKYNTYESFNTLSDSINSNQSITYTRFVDTTCNISFFNKRCQFEYEFLPFQQSLNNANLSSELNNKYLQFIKTFKYSFELLDTSNVNILKVDFTHSNLHIRTSNFDHSFAINTIMDNINWNRFYIVNFDNLNKNNLSIYLNNINYGLNLNIPSLNLQDLKQIKINVPIYDNNNYYNFSLASNISSGTNIYYNLIHYNTQLRFRNFNIFLSTYDVTTALTIGSTESEIYNIIIGNRLDIKGLNNICLGKNFKTTGKGSIILGSDIGVQFNTDGTQVNTFNEIFNSIVISNNSFRNSRVRDVIAVGNDILNDITGNIEEFLSKKPVLVGNNIDNSKIDFHINFQNTFLKTTVGSPQIYCGLEQENVCIGYTSNIQVNNEYILHVNGGMEINGPIKVTNSYLSSSRVIFGNILFNSGTLHTCKVTISWDNVQSSDYHAFSINCKFRFINNENNYGFRRFEIWITPKNDVINNKPNLLSDLEIATFYTSDITNLSHSVQRNGDTSINLFISWNTSATLNSTNYILGTLELESSFPSALGSLKYTTPVAI